MEQNNAEAGQKVSSSHEPSPGFLNSQVTWIQPYLVFVGVVSAFVYAVGRLIQYGTILKLGLGPLSPTRESILGTGIGFLFFALPYIVAYDFVKDITSKPRVTFWMKALSYLVAVLGSIAVTYMIFGYLVQESTVPAGWKTSLSWFFSGPFLFNLSCLILLLWIGPKLTIESIRSRMKNRYNFTLALVFTFLTLRSYTNHIAPYLNPLLGGYLMQPVYIEENSKLQRRLIVSADSDYVIFGSYPNKSSFWNDLRLSNKDLNVYRTRWEDVKTINKIVPQPLAATKQPTQEQPVAKR